MIFLFWSIYHNRFVLLFSPKNILTFVIRLILISLQKHPKPSWIHLILWARPLFLLTQATLMMVVVGPRSRDGLCSLWSKHAFYSTTGQASVGASWALTPQTKRAPRRREMRQLDKRCNCIAKHELLDLTHLATSFLLQIKCFSCIFVSAKNKICSNYGSSRGPLDWISRY